VTLTRRPGPRPPMPLQAAIERLMSDWQMPGDAGMNELAPPLDVRETDDAYIVEIDLPGIDPNQTEVLVEGRTVTIRGTFEHDEEQRQGNYLLRERRRGQFMRAVALPGMVELDQVSSRFEDGQLTIVLPKASHSRARRIEIGAGGGQGATGGAPGGTTQGSQSASSSGQAAGSGGAQREAGSASTAGSASSAGAGTAGGSGAAGTAATAGPGAAGEKGGAPSGRSEGGRSPKGSGG
jgi:HSP20 family protein